MVAGLLSFFQKDYMVVAMVVGEKAMFEARPTHPLLAVAPWLFAALC